MLRCWVALVGYVILNGLTRLIRLARLTYLIAIDVACVVAVSLGRFVVQIAVTVILTAVLIQRGVRIVPSISFGRILSCVIVSGGLFGIQGAQ